jgi:hypothetical protein
MRSIVFGLLAAYATAQQCTYNTPAGPTNTVDGHISQLSMNGKTYAPTCPGKIGVDDQTATFNPSIGSTGTLSATFHTCGGSYQNGGEVWVDWTNSGSFSKSVGSVGTWQGIASNAVHQFAITVPPGTSGGAKRARIMMDEGALPPLDPCLSFSYGSMIDFTLVVGGGGGGGGESGGLSFGGIMLILIVVLVPVYIAAGCVYKRKKLGTTGMLESCPQSEFWMSIPGLVKDGFAFTLVKLKIKKQASTDYDSL